MNLKIQRITMPKICVKTDFLSLEEAQARADYVNFVNSRKGQARRSAPYKCRVCGKIHLYSYKKNDTKDQDTAAKSQKFAEKEAGWYMMQPRKPEKLIKKFKVKRHGKKK